MRQLVIKVVNIIDARCNHEVYKISVFGWILINSNTSYTVNKSTNQYTL